MHFVRRIGLFFATFFFGILLFLLVSTASLAQTIGKPSTLKGWLKSSGIYTKVVPAVLEQSSKNTDSPTGSDTSISFKDPNVQKIAEQAFSPQFIQQSSESAIDGSYKWLQGKTTKPQFTITVSTAKDAFANGVGNYIRNRAAKLPVCTTLPASFDILNATCVPKGINVNTEAQKVVSQIVTSKDFLPDPTVTADTDKTSNNTAPKPLYQAQPNLPKYYRLLVLGPWIFGGLALLAAAGIIWLNEDHRRGLRKVMATLFTTGGLLLIYIAAVSYGFNKIQARLTKDTSGSQVSTLKQSAITALKSASHDISRVAIIYGVVFIVIGAAVAVYLLMTRPNAPKPIKHPLAEDKALDKVPQK
ncbi:MAG: hypothetical protein JWS12_452 [Candidatus Saccharibacteria bacterium]|nr:hypothetical protein [Candidatus Saccharibacteria bacterium]